MDKLIRILRISAGQRWSFAVVEPFLPRFQNLGDPQHHRPPTTPPTELTEHEGEHTFSGSLKEESHDKNLQPGHAHHQPTLDHTEVKDPRLRALHRAEVAVLPRAEVFLHAADGR